MPMSMKTVAVAIAMSISVSIAVTAGTMAYHFIDTCITRAFVIMPMPMSMPVFVAFLVPKNNVQ